MNDRMFKVLGRAIKPEIALPVSATILDLKTRIKTLLDLPIDRQTIYYSDGTNAQALENNRTIESYDFNYPSVNVVLEAEFLPEDTEFQIRVSCRSIVALVMVKETELVLSLKKKISSLLKIPIHKMTLLRNEQAMDSGFELFHYYICEGSVIKVRVHGIIEKESTAATQEQEIEDVSSSETEEEEEENNGENPTDE